MNVQTFDYLSRTGLLEIGDGYRAKNDELGGAGPIFLRSAYLQDNGFTLTDPERFKSVETACFGPKLSQLGDVVITTKGNSTGRIGRIRNAETGAVYSPHLSYWRSRSPEYIDQNFLYYWASSEEFRRQLAGMAHSTDMAPYLSLRDQLRLKISLPEISRQVEIGSTLSALDDKIELNRRMNEALEASARALFRDWFVDFGPTRAKAEGRPAYLTHDLWSLFPERMADDGAPEGWEWGTLADIARNANVKVEPNSIAPDTPYIGLEHMPRQSIALTAWEGAGKVSSAKSAFKTGQILFGKLRPYFHKVGVAPVDGICSTDIVVLEAMHAHNDALVLACVSTEDFVAFTDQGSTGTKMPRTSWSMMARYPLVRPDPKLAEGYQRVVGPMVDQIIANIMESRTLAETRDMLLPKLMSGAIRVRDARALAEAPL